MRVIGGLTNGGRARIISAKSGRATAPIFPKEVFPLRAPGRSLFPVLAVLALLAALAFAACDGDGGTTVDVVLSEWLVDPEVTSAPAGEVTFVANNEGTIEHELVIIKTDLPHDAMPTHEMDHEMVGVVDEEAAGIEIIDEIEEFSAGGSESLTLNLGPGNYVLICNIGSEEEGGEHGGHESHYQEGMHTAFTVE